MMEMRTLLQAMLILLLAISTTLLAALPVVHNVALSHSTDGSGIITISYDVDDVDGGEVYIEVFASDDNGDTWDYDISTTSGDIGTVAVGTGKSIAWDFGADHPDTYTNQLVVKITAEDEVFLTDYDGNVYETVRINGKLWTKTNLKVTHYRNGVAIPEVLDNSAWGNLTSGAYTYCNGDENNTVTYGLLYNWYAVDDSRSIAPEGWHVATNDEWQAMVDYLGGDSVAGGKLKEAGLTHWSSPNIGATNQTGFTGLPAGFRDSYGGYGGLTDYTHFWTSSMVTFLGQTKPSEWRLHTSESRIVRIDGYEKNGFSVRLVRD